MQTIRLTEEQFKGAIKDEVHQMIECLAADYGGPGLFDYLSDKKYICEGLIRTYPYEKIIETLSNAFNLNDEDIQTLEKERDGEIITLIMVFLPANLGKIDIARLKGNMNSYGYRLCKNPGRFKVTNGKRAYLFEPKFPNDITMKVKENYQYLYHLTTGKGLRKIKQMGIVPRGNDELGIDGYENYRLINNPKLGEEAIFLYPDRAYFFKRMGDEQTKAINSLMKTHEEDDEFYLLVIDIKKIPGNVKFFNDSWTDGGIYTYNNLPKECIMSIIDMQTRK